MSISTPTMGMPAGCMLLVLLSLIPAAHAQPEAMPGIIAYIRDGDEIRLVEPDGSNDRLIWTVPDLELHEIHDLAWRPDAGEIAFSSNHELDCSIYESDIYAIRPDGSGLRRVTNPPACADLANYPMGTVTVSVQNFAASGTFFVYMQGAPAALQIDLAPGETGTVTFEDVADFGDDTWQQAVVSQGLLRWNAPLTGADVKPGESVQAGTLNITSLGIRFFGALLPSWRNDGSVVGYTFGPCAALYQVPSDAPPGLERHTPVLNVDPAPACVMDWGPTPALMDQILYWNYDDGIYRVTEGSSDRGEQLVFTAAPDFLWGLEWLPDGSGFLYSTETDFNSINIYAYDFATGAVTQLTQFTNEYARGFSLSPDGQWVVFERTATQDDLSELWIMRRDGSDMRRLVEEGGDPAWRSSIASTAVELPKEEIPANLEVYPHPVRSEATLTFYLQKPQSVTVTVHDLLGREVLVRALGHHPSGQHKVALSTLPSPAGLYFISVAGSEGERMTRRMVVF